jgi:hypothetical protein
VARVLPLIVVCALLALPACHRSSGGAAAAASSSVAVAPPAPPPRWTSLGILTTSVRDDTGESPADASGRVMAVRVDPRDPAVVYLGTVGGVFRSTDFSSDAPTWTLLTDGLGASAFVALDLDPNDPDRVVAGTGDPHMLPGPGGGAVYRSSDRGETWSEPVLLAGTNARGETVQAGTIRDVAIDASSSGVVLVAARHGLFRSKDGGATFSLEDLPNVGGKPLEDEMWSLAYLGAGRWAAAGVEECPPGDAGAATPPLDGSPPPTCTSAQAGDIWRSEDTGATWTSLRVAGAMPLHEKDGGLGRMTLATGALGAPDKTVVFAMVARANEGGTIDVFRSTDGAKTFGSAAGTFTSAASCPKAWDIGAGQSGYGQAVAVDPTSADHVFVGGMECSMRSLNALSPRPAWEIASSTNPITYGKPRPAGAPPFVHGDFHAARIAKTPGGVRLIVGDDGGVDVAENPFARRPADARWSQRNHGLSTQLVGCLASGDPADGDADVVIAGLQDNGAVMRDRAGPAWDTFHGGDGRGTGIVSGPRGTIYWSGYVANRWYCKPAEADCHRIDAWKPSAPQTLAPGDGLFSSSVAPLPLDPDGAMLAATSHNVYRVDLTPAWTPISPGGFRYHITRVVASPTTQGLYGAVFYEARCAVTADGDAPAPHWDVSAPIADHGRAYAAGMAFPPKAPDGARPGDVYLCGRVLSVDEVPTTPTLFVTRDRGKTFAPLHGDRGDLPWASVFAIAYDPRDATGGTIYVASGAGVYRTTDGGRAWARYGVGLPYVPVTDLFVSKGGDLLRAATWGRGVWEAR